MTFFRWLDKLVGDPLRNFQGIRRCPTVSSLLRYMKGKSYDQLQYWVENRMWYTPDDTTGRIKHKLNWTPIEVVLARDVLDHYIESDCEERSVVKRTVVNGLGWGLAENIVIVRKDQSKNHAVCAVWDPKELLILDYRTYRFPFGFELTEAVRIIYPDAVYYYFAKDDGIPTSERIYIEKKA